VIITNDAHQTMMNFHKIKQQEITIIGTSMMFSVDFNLSLIGFEFN
jgi:hypothetical protein